MKSDTLKVSDLAELRDWLRHRARRHGVPVELRARLVVAATAVAGRELRAGRAVLFEAGQERIGDGRDVVVTAWSPDATAPLSLADLPLAPRPVSDSGAGVVWRLPTGQGHALGSEARSSRLPAADTAVREEGAEEELRAVLAGADALRGEHLRLKDELAETNSGVLALYVQLEERDEQLRAAHGHIFRELEDALRPPAPAADGFELGVHYAPAGTDAPTGGDLYDWFVLPDGTLHITVVDALGHGVTSTRGALSVTHAVRTLVLENHPLETVVARTDEILHPIAPELMATVLLVQLDPVSGELRVANGSHPPALLHPVAGPSRYLEVPGRGVGFPLPGSDRTLVARMAPDDLLVLYTDGLTESRRDPREGELRLREVVRQHATEPIDMLAGLVAEDMRTVVLHPDDTLVLAVRATQPRLPRPRR